MAILRKAAAGAGFGAPPPAQTCYYFRRGEGILQNNAGLLVFAITGILSKAKGANMLKEFKEFAMRGNVLDMAVGIVVGASFGGIVTSLVNDILMPPIGLVLGKVDFSNLFISLTSRHFETVAAAKAAGAATLNYGVFLNAIINFVIVSFAIFLLVRQVNKLRSPAPAPAPPAERPCPYCCTQIPTAATRCPHCTSQLKAD